MAIKMTTLEIIIGLLLNPIFMVLSKIQPPAVNKCKGSESSVTGTVYSVLGSGGTGRAACPLSRSRLAGGWYELVADPRAG